MATHSGILVWRIPWTESMGFQSWTRLSDCHTHNMDFTVIEIVSGVKSVPSSKSDLEEIMLICFSCITFLLLVVVY